MYNRDTQAWVAHYTYVVVSLSFHMSDLSNYGPTMYTLPCARSGTELAQRLDRSLEDKTAFALFVDIEVCTKYA